MTFNNATQPEQVQELVLDVTTVLREQMSGTMENAAFTDLRNTVTDITYILFWAILDSTAEYAVDKKYAPFKPNNFV